MKTPSIKSLTGALASAIKDCLNYDPQNRIKINTWSGSKIWINRGKESYVSLHYDGNKLWIGYHNEYSYSPYSIKSYVCSDVSKAINKALNYVLWELRQG